VCGPRSQTPTGRGTRPPTRSTGPGAAGGHGWGSLSCTRSAMSRRSPACSPAWPRHRPGGRSRAARHDRILSVSCVSDLRRVRAGAARSELAGSWSRRSPRRPPIADTGERVGIGARRRVRRCGDPGSAPGDVDVMRMRTRLAVIAAGLAAALAVARVAIADDGGRPLSTGLTGAAEAPGPGRSERHRSGRPHAQPGSERGLLRHQLGRRRQSGVRGPHPHRSRRHGGPRS
jgi:hypothetical protein